MHLHITNKEVSSCNCRNIMDAANLIVLIEAKNTGRSKSMKEDNFRGLLAKLYLSVNSKVLLARNQLNASLSNCSMGITKGIACNDDRPAFKLPKFT